MSEKLTFKLHNAYYEAMIDRRVVSFCRSEFREIFDIERGVEELTFEIQRSDDFSDMAADFCHHVEGVYFGRFMYRRSTDRIDSVAISYSTDSRDNVDSVNFVGMHHVRKLTGESFYFRIYQ